MKKVFLLGLSLFIILLIGGIRKRDRTLDLGMVLELKGDKAFQHYEIEKACRYWQKVIKENPEDLKAYNKLGISFLLLKEYGTAMDILKQGLRIDSNDPGLNYNLGLAYFYSGDHQKALAQLETTLDLNRSYPEANYLKGLCLENMGREEEARAAYIEELNNNPGSRLAWQKVRREL